MSRRRRVDLPAALLFPLLVLVSPATGAAQMVEGTEGAAPEVRPVQLALFHPVQLFPESTAITGARINLIYGRNVSVTGLDLGLVNHTTGGRSVAFQYGVVGLAEDEFVGWQNNFVNVTRGSFQGLQDGAVNSVGRGEGLQVGVVNRADHMEGLMLGVVNYTGTMNGLQIGLVNIISQKPELPVLPIVNWTF